MSTVYLSPLAKPGLISYLERSGHRIQYTENSAAVDPAVSLHPDIYMCKLGAEPASPVFFGDPELPRAPYPGDVPYNAAVCGRYIICNCRTVSAELIEAARAQIGPEAQLIHVPQGYTKCNLAVVDDSHVITEDEGIYAALSGLPDLKCLKIEAKHVELAGYPYGFIGGASGRVDSEMLFNGDISLHPDYPAIARFCEDCGVGIRYFPGPLEDIGSIIQAL